MSVRKKIYTQNKSKKVGETCICPICKKEFVKKHYAQAFCSNDCKVKFHNDKQVGKRNEYFRKYNMKHTERYTRVGIDIEFEKWKEKYYEECYANMEDGDCICEIDKNSLISQYEDETGNVYIGDIK